MIHSILPVIIEDLNTHLQRKFNVPTRDKKVLLTNLMNANGSLNEQTDEKLVCSLVNVQEEEIKPPRPSIKGAMKNAPIYLNLTTLFAANFKDYNTSLKFLSGVISFFQGKQVFTAQNTPALNGQIDKIYVKILNLESRELSSLWSMLGAKYMPSILYKFKIISIDQDMIIEEIPSITEISGNLK